MKDRIQAEVSDLASSHSVAYARRSIAQSRLLRAFAAFNLANSSADSRNCISSSRSRYERQTPSELRFIYDRCDEISARRPRTVSMSSATCP
jgi:hypothetical protein